MERILSWKSTAFLLCNLCIIQCGGHFRPIAAIVKLLSDDLAYSFPQQLISVTWCLFPSVPENKTSSYVKLINQATTVKYFKVEHHIKCKYGWPGSPKGLDGARERYISEVQITEQEYRRKTKFTDNFNCRNGPNTQQVWLTELYTVPWEEVTCTCKSAQRSISIQRKKVYNGGKEVITVNSSLACP